MSVPPEDTEDDDVEPYATMKALVRKNGAFFLCEALSFFFFFLVVVFSLLFCLKVCSFFNSVSTNKKGDDVYIYGFLAELLSLITILIAFSNMATSLNSSVGTNKLL